MAPVAITSTGADGSQDPAGSTGQGVPEVVAVDRRRTAFEIALLDGLTLAGIGSVVTGFVVLYLGWRGVAGTLDVQVQLSYVVSGGVAGLVLIGIGCAFIVTQSDRYVTARVGRAHARLAAQWKALADDLAVADRRER